MLRRPPSICMRNVDAKPPAFSSVDTPDALCQSCLFLMLCIARAPRCLTPLSVDHHWQYGFLSHCMLPILDCVTSTQPTSYTEILGLDHRVRNFDYPTMLQMVDNASLPASEAMQQAMVACTREIGTSIPVACGPSFSSVPELIIAIRSSVIAPAQELLHTGSDVVPGLHDQAPVRTLGAGGVHKRVHPDLGRRHAVLLGACAEHALHDILVQLLLGSGKRGLNRILIVWLTSSSLVCAVPPRLPRSVPRHRTPCAPRAR